MAGKGFAGVRGGVKASGAWQRTVTAAKGQEEEVCLWPGFPHTNTSQRAEEGLESRRGSSVGAGASQPRPHSTTHAVGYGDNQGRTGLPRSTSAPTEYHSLLLPSLLLTINVDLSTSGEAKDSDPAAASASTEEPGKVQEGHRVPRQTGWRIKAARLSRCCSLTCPLAAVRARVRAGRAPPQPPPGGRKVTAISHAEIRSYSRC